MKKVLDHGYVRLIDYMGDDLSIVRAARVSHNAEWRTGRDEGSDRRLINYLWRNHHTTPFEAVAFTFEIKAPIFVLRQWHRHRTWSYNEVSARYTQLPSEFYVPDPLIMGLQSRSNKQGRDIGDDLSGPEMALAEKNARLIRHTSEASFLAYRELLRDGCPRELARSVLPVNTYSHMFASTNLLNLLKFLTLRRHAHAQYEIRVYADAILEIIRQFVPETINAWENEAA